MPEAMPQPMPPESGPPEDEVTTPNYTGQVNTAEEPFLVNPEESGMTAANDNTAPEEAPATAGESAELLPSREEVLNMLRDFTAHDGTRDGLKAVLTTMLGKGVRFLRRRPNSSAEDVVDIDKLITEIQGGGPLPTYNEPDDLHRALQTVRDLEPDGRVEEVSNGEAMTSPEVEAAPAVQEQLHAFASRLEPFAVTDVVALLRTMPEVLPATVPGKNPVNRDTLIARLEAGERPETGNTSINQIIYVLSELESQALTSAGSVEAAAETVNPETDPDVAESSAMEVSPDATAAEIADLEAQLAAAEAAPVAETPPAPEVVPESIRPVELVAVGDYRNGDSVDGNARLTQLDTALRSSGLGPYSRHGHLLGSFMDNRDILIKSGEGGGFGPYRDAVRQQIGYNRLSIEEKNAVNQTLNSLARSMRLTE